MSESNEPSGKNNKQVVYSLSEDYWAKQPATVDGMLGGYEFISDIDIEQSQQFLNSFLKVLILDYLSSMTINFLQ